MHILLFNFALLACHDIPMFYYSDYPTKYRCAVSGQDIITEENNWSVLNNSRGYTLQTGDIAMFALGEGESWTTYPV